MKRSTQKPSSRAVALAGAILASTAILIPAYAGEKSPEKYSPQNYPPGSSGMRAPLDSDKDGRVSRNEAERDAALKQRFDTLDSNRDGTLDAAELAARGDQGPTAGTEVKR